MALSPLRHARLDAGLTLFDVQQRAVIPQCRLSLVERGLVAPRRDEQERLADVLGREIASLFPGSGRSEGRPQDRLDAAERARRSQLRRHLNTAVEALRAAQAKA